MEQPAVLSYGFANPSYSILAQVFLLLVWLLFSHHSIANCEM
jgi:hypothetical protein